MCGCFATYQHWWNLPEAVLLTLVNICTKLSRLSQISPPIYNAQLLRVGKLILAHYLGSLSLTNYHYGFIKIHHQLHTEGKYYATEVI